VSTSRRFQLRLGEPLASELNQFARARNLRACPAIRVLIRLGLESNADRPDEGSTVALAALVAAEHAVAMVASILPDGERRMEELAQRAALAAEARMAMLREAGR